MAFDLWHRLKTGEETLTGISVATIVSEYLADLAPRVKASTVHTKTKILSRLSAELGSTSAAGFTEGKLATWLNKASWGQTYRWLASRIVATLFRWAVSVGHLDENPVKNFRCKPARTRGAETAVTQAVHEQVMAAALEQGTKDILTALWETGCRPSEVCSVQVQHFDRAAGVWILAEHKTDRHGKPRVIYLSDTMLALCNRLIKKHPTGHLFRNQKGRPFEPTSLSRWFCFTRKRLGIGPVILYGYRHGFATAALERGVPDAHVAELLGHSGTTMLHKHYSHLGSRSDALRSALKGVRA